MLQQALQAQPEGVADARRHVRDRLDGLLSSETVAEAELLTSELVTNAVRHAGLQERDAVNLEIDVDTDTVHVAVVDAGSGFDFSKIFDEPRDLAEGGGYSSSTRCRIAGGSTPLLLTASGSRSTAKGKHSDLARLTPDWTLAQAGTRLPLV